MRKGLRSKDMKKLHPVYTLDDSWGLPKHFQLENDQLSCNELDEDMYREYTDYCRRFSMRLKRVQSTLLSEVITKYS